jgi:hypothetical protein
MSAVLLSNLSEIKLRAKSIANLHGLYGKPPGFFTSASFASLDLLSFSEPFEHILAPPSTACRTFNPVSRNAPHRYMNDTFSFIGLNVQLVAIAPPPLVVGHEGFTAASNMRSNLAIIQEFLI